jgi:hypothetical protein
MAIQDLKTSPNSQTEAKSSHIMEEYLASGAPCQVVYWYPCYRQGGLKYLSILHRTA